jgi:hypothetical protein
VLGVWRVMRNGAVLTNWAGRTSRRHLAPQVKTKGIPRVGESGERIDSTEATQIGSTSLGLPRHPIQQAFEPAFMA